MRQVRSINTVPELRVRRALRALRVPVRVQCRNLPGTPDFAIRRSKIAIFVHGCFWHQHACPRGNRRPVSNVAYWKRKLNANQKRDRVVMRSLRRLGWKTLVVWECQTTGSRLGTLISRLRRALGLTQRPESRTRTKRPRG
jgi:DNA mismatch endonuclease (patch repair protein)